MQESEYFTQELSLDVNYLSRFVQHPHYPIACCLPHLSTVAHNCRGKSINLTVKRKSHSKKKKIHGKKNNLTGKRKWLAAKRKRLKAKRKPHDKKKKTHGEISLIPREHFNSYLFCREVVVILFAVKLFFLPWCFSFCREVNSFAMTVVPLKFCSRRFLIFQPVGIREN